MWMVPMINGGGGYLRLTPSVPLLVLLVPVSPGGGVPVSTGGGVPVFSRANGTKPPPLVAPTTLPRIGGTTQGPTLRRVLADAVRHHREAVLADGIKPPLLVALKSRQGGTKHPTHIGVGATRFLSHRVLHPHTALDRCSRHQRETLQPDDKAVSTYL